MRWHGRLTEVKLRTSGLSRLYLARSSSNKKLQTSQSEILSISLAAADPIGTVLVARDIDPSIGGEVEPPTEIVILEAGTSLSLNIMSAQTTLGFNGQQFKV